MVLLLDIFYGLAFVVGWPYLLYRRWKRGPGSLALGERMGRIASRPVSAHSVWIHAVSLGEVNATRTLVSELHRRSPNTVVTLSSTTQTGLERARAIYPRMEVFRFPLDFSFVIRRVLTRIRPSVIVLMELEVWPNLIEVAARWGVPVIIANGRITDEKSMRRFRQVPLRWIARRMFGRLAWVGAQDSTYAQRFIELGVPPQRVEITGSIKYDAADVTDHIEGQDALATEMGISQRQPLWVCGSTGPEEERMVLDAYARVLERFPDLQLAIIPRKPERFDEVAALIVGRGYACLRRSSGAPAIPPTAEAARPVFLGDTMGELRKFYALADVVFVGRSLVPMGGSDVMEVAGLARAMIVGPFTENFAEAVQLLCDEGGCRRVAQPEELAEALHELLASAALRRTMGNAARQAILSRRGATERTLDRILSILQAD